MRIEPKAISMSRISNGSIIVGVLVIAAALGLGLRPGSTETVFLSEVPLPDPVDDPAAAVVVGMYETGGFSLFGLQIGAVTHTVTVSFHAAPGCFDHASFGDPWPTPFEECSSTVTIEGIISGGGTEYTGDTIVSVDVEVPDDCYDTVNRGDPWPFSAAECSTHAGLAKVQFPSMSTP
jgi:hypothetical protein